MNPEEKKCYVTRSKCWLQLGNAENALTDAEEALRQDKEYIPVSLKSQRQSRNIWNNRWRLIILINEFLIHFIDFFQGLYQKAEAMYQLGDFETSLVFFHRGHKLRPELQEFRLGIQKAQEAINNSIGSRDLYSSVHLVIHRL